MSWEEQVFGAGHAAEIARADAALEAQQRKEEVVASFASQHADLIAEAKKLDAIIDGIPDEADPEAKAELLELTAQGAAYIERERKRLRDLEEGISPDVPRRYRRGAI